MDSAKTEMVQSIILATIAGGNMIEKCSACGQMVDKTIKYMILIDEGKRDYLCGYCKIRVRTLINSTEKRARRETNKITPSILKSRIITLEEKYRTIPLDGVFQYMTYKKDNETYLDPVKHKQAISILNEINFSEYGRPIEWMGNQTRILLSEEGREKILELIKHACDSRTSGNNRSTIVQGDDS